MMDNVEVYNCSQRDTFKAAIRFEGSQNKWSSVTNSAFHHGLGKGLQVAYSKNLYLSNNIFFDFIQMGGNVETSSNITIQSNAFFHVGVRVDKFGGLMPINGGLILCGLTAGDICTGLRVVNNYVAGVPYAGYGAPGVDCTDNDGWAFRDNIAHSVNGTGAIFYPSASRSSHSYCFKGSHFIAYKNSRYGALTYSRGVEVQFQNMYLIDNTFGAGLNIGSEGNYRKAYMNNIFIWGDSSVNRDCAVQNSCEGPACQNKSGIVFSTFTTGWNTPFPKDWTEQDDIRTDAAWGGRTRFENVFFIDFPSNKTFCGGKLSLFNAHKNASDYIPYTYLYQPTFIRVSSDALGHFPLPRPEWATVERCGIFPCTGPLNTFVSFDRPTFTEVGSAWTLPKQSFYVHSRNDLIASGLGCEPLNNAWNGHYCSYNNELGTVIFES